MQLMQLSLLVETGEDLMEVSLQQLMVYTEIQMLEMEIIIIIPIRQ